MSIKKFSLLLVSALSCAALFSGCGSSSKEGSADVGGVAKTEEATCRHCHASTLDPVSKTPIVEDFMGTVSASNPGGTHPSVHFQLPSVSGLDGAINTEAGCQGCHGGGAQHNGVGPIPFNNPLTSGRCNAVECHNGTVPAGFAATDYVAMCSGCHGGNGIHSIKFSSNPVLHDDCIGCHSVAKTKHPSAVNPGVRAVTAEFGKWSHHVTGVNLQNAHCAACHLAGKAKEGKVVVDHTYHMTGGATHLRNADTDADMQWDPAAPNHSTMDNFCMSCHDANGATSPKSAGIRALMIPAAGKTASASNPFGDTISNRYDKMQRPAVVDVDTQFNTGNASHHAVKGPKYTGRTRTAGSRQIANPAAFDDNSSATLWGKRSTIYDSVNSISGVVETTNLAFNALYVPLENAGGEVAPRTGAQTLGDDSTLHCGDCHTVGQWKAGTAQWFNTDGTVDATKVSPAIGAHGSNNEYMLRNSKGTDERHTQDAYVKAASGVITLQNPNAAFLVCFNCHSYSRYGSVYNATGTKGPHAGEYDSSGRCNGVGNTIPFNGYTSGKATDGTQFLSRFEGPRAAFSSTPAFAPGFPLNFANAPGGVQAATYTGEQEPDFGNIFGIQCNNCHNAGVENGYGGIHGSKVNTYVDGMGNTQKTRRFLPGLGNVKHVPGTLGGITGGTVAGPVTNSTYSIQVGGVVTTGSTVYTYTTGGVSKDTNWEQVSWTQIPNAERGVLDTRRAGAGCYTLSPTTGKVASGLKGQSVDGGATIPDAYGTWGGCDDHQGTGAQGGGDHGFIKRINRPVTY